MTEAEFADLALSLPGVVESAHFGKRDFRAGGKIFATLPSPATANLNLTPDQQALLLAVHAGLYQAVANAWGARGWTTLDIASAGRDIALSGLAMAHDNVLTKKPKKKR